MSKNIILKKPLTYEEQLSRLRDFHNLKITDNEAAVRILKRVNYYRLSAYGLGLTVCGNKDVYQDDISLEHIYRLYVFDSYFRNKLIHIIEQIEIQLRAQISNHLALKYGAECYMDPSNFEIKYDKSNTTIHQKIINNFESEKIRQQNIPFVKHHFEHYGGHFPIWVAVELFTFGNISSLYSIMHPEDRKAIADIYGTSPNYLGSWIQALVEVRNICAHYGRIYNMPLKQAPRLYQEHRKYQDKRQNKIFPVLLVIRRMIISNSIWDGFESSLEDLFNAYSDVIILSYSGFPDDWISVLRYY